MPSSPWLTCTCELHREGDFTQSISMLVVCLTEWVPFCPCIRHIISQDFISDALKNKKHWNSFNPDHGFFLHLDDLLEWVDKGTLKQHNKSKSAYEKLLNEPIKCYKCDETFGTVPRLKEHLLEDFETLRRAAVGGTTSSSAEGQAEKKHEADSVDGESDAKRRKQK